MLMPDPAGESYCALCISVIHTQFIGHFSQYTQVCRLSAAADTAYTHQYRQDQGNGERRHSVSHTHSE